MNFRLVIITTLQLILAARRAAQREQYITEREN